ncbi:hypothetical protein B0H14DRAFT_2585713 [Mycena olivaceomarginata]|nr:hypothetical protein B0H14DRAFT_2585713 [Mycena olivaceomarginata]
MGSNSQALRSERGGRIQRPGVKLRGGRWDRTTACQAVVGSGIEPPHIKQWWSVRSHRRASSSEGCGEIKQPGVELRGGGGIEPPRVKQWWAVGSSRHTSSSEGRGEIEWPVVELRGGWWDRTARRRAVVGSEIEPLHIEVRGARWDATASMEVRGAQWDQTARHRAVVGSEMEPPGVEVRAQRWAVGSSRQHNSGKWVENEVHSVIRPPVKSTGRRSDSSADENQGYGGGQV